MESGNIFSDLCRKYYELSIPVIPLAPRGKNPVVKDWSRYCRALPSAEEMSVWEQEYPNGNIGLALGAASEIVGVDIDTDDPFLLDRINKILPASLVRKKGAKGETAFFRYAGHPSRKFRLHPQGKPIVELLSDGNQTVLPGSIHPETGKPYIWVTPDTLLNLKASELPDLPVDFMDRVEKAFLDLKSTLGDFSRSGGRNETLKQQVIAAIHKGKSNGEVISEILKFDQTRHKVPLFSDPSESQMHGHSPEENAARFVASIRRSVQIPEATEKSWGALKKLPRLLPEAPRLTPDLADLMLPEPLKPWLCDISRRLQVPLESVSVCAFGGIGALLGRKIAIFPKRHDDWSTLASLWVAIIDRPGRKKTPTITEALKPLELIEAELRKEYESSLAKAKAESAVLDARISGVKDRIKAAIKESNENEVIALQGELEKLSSEQEEKCHAEKRLRTNDATIEKIARLLKENTNGILLFRDELCGWLSSLEKTGFEGAREFFLEAWNCQKDYVVDRVGSGTTYIPSLLINVIGGIQPGKLESYIQQAIRGGVGDDGLLQRFQLAVYPEKIEKFEYVDSPPDMVARKRAEYIFQRLHKLKPEEIGSKLVHGKSIPGLRFTEDAQELFDEWSKQLEYRLHAGSISSPALESHLSKYRSLMPALALVFHLIDYADHREIQDGVSLSAAKKAAIWCEFLEGHARKVYACASELEIHSAHALAQKIKEGKVKDGDSLRSIYRHHWSLLDTQAEVEAAVAVLEECEWVRVEKKSAGGAPTEILKLHTDLMAEGV